MEIPLEVLFEDESLIAVQKPIGLVVDAGAERSEENRDVIGVLAERGLKTFAFHRLDKGTSGIVLLGKSRKYAREVTAMFEEKKIRKAYLAVVQGEWPGTLSRVDSKVGDRESLTTFRVLAKSAEKSWIEALPKTGRKHQIRIQCAESGFPILGDRLYNAGAGAGDSVGGGHALHAYNLSFRHPGSGEAISIRSAPWAWRETYLEGLEFEKAWSNLFGAK